MKHYPRSESVNLMPPTSIPAPVVSVSTKICLEVESSTSRPLTCKLFREKPLLHQIEKKSLLVGASYVELDVTTSDVYARSKKGNLTSSQAGSVQRQAETQTRKTSACFISELATRDLLSPTEVPLNEYMRSIKGSMRTPPILLPANRLRSSSHHQGPPKQVSFSPNMIVIQYS